MKRLVAVIIAVCFGFTLQLCAAGLSLDPTEEFTTDKESVSEVLGITSSELTEYLDDNQLQIIAVNADNTKQIRVGTEETDFSKATINLSLLKDGEIIEIADTLSGLTDAKHEVAEKNGQKFLRTNMDLEDSGGNYSLVQYLTVADKQVYKLSFYTSAGADESYIADIFATFEADGFLEGNEKTGNTFTSVLVIAGIVLFGAICAVIIITIIKDIRQKEETE